MNEGKMMGSQGTPEEIKNAKEFMTPTQREVSGYRESGFEQLKKMGAENIEKTMLDQVMKLRKEHDGLKSIISGKIDGHDIVIKSEYTVEGQRSYDKAILCLIDGKKTSLEVAQKLKDKIYVINEFLGENSHQASIIKEELKEFIDADKIAEDLLAKM